MWPECSSVKAVKLMKKSATVTETIYFFKGTVFLLAHPVYMHICILFVIMPGVLITNKQTIFLLTVLSKTVITANRNLILRSNTKNNTALW